MLFFHLRVFSQNSYFLQLLLTSTLSVLLLQFIASLNSNLSVDGTAWLRAGMVGTWSVSTVAAGLIGFQRFQGTLVHIVLSPLSVGKVLLPLIASACSFGLLAFPLAALAAAILRIPFQTTNMATLIVGVVCLWLSCLAVSSVVSSLFVLTPNAITYEGLLLVPMVLISGIFGIPASIEIWVTPVSYVIPTSPAVQAILHNTASPQEYWANICFSILGSIAWFLAGHLLVRRATRRAINDGTLEVI